jgi:hypothetical protein
MIMIASHRISSQTPRSRSATQRNKVEHWAAKSDKSAAKWLEARCRKERGAVPGDEDSSDRHCGCD